MSVMHTVSALFSLLVAVALGCYAQPPGGSFVQRTAIHRASSDAITFNYQQGDPDPDPQYEQLWSTSGDATRAFAATSNSWWLTVSPSSGSLPATLTIAAHPTGLAAGPYGGVVTVTSTNSQPAYVNVFLYVTAFQPVDRLLAAPSSLTFNCHAGDSGIVPASITLNSTGAPLPYTVSATSGGSWLSVIGTTPVSSGVWGGTSPGTVSVFANPKDLRPGTYTGNIQISSSRAINNQQSIPVTLVVAPLDMTVAPNSLSFTYQEGGALPQPQSFSVSASGIPIFFNASNGSANWMVLGATSGVTPSHVSVSVNPVVLGAGSYSGTISIVSSDGAVSKSVAVNLTVITAPVLTLSPATLSFRYQIGQSLPAPQQVQVGSISGPVSFTVQSSGNWLTVNQAGTTPTTIYVGVAPMSLAVGTYTGNFTITATAATNSPLILPVSLSILADTTPKISGILNTATSQPGVMPGGLVTIQGTNLSTVSDPGRTWTQVDVQGVELPRVLEGTSVLVNNKPAAVLFASAKQLKIQAPDDNARGSIVVQITTPTGSVSASATLLPLAPSLFVSNVSNYVLATHEDGTPVNADDSATGGSSTPAQPGTIIWLFGTGFGATDPLLPPCQTVTAPAQLADNFIVTVGGVVATVYYGGIIGPGLYQFNVVVPDLPDGDQDVFIEIDGQRTQTGVSVPLKTATAP